jgi:hypothetical protein
MSSIIFIMNEFPKSSIFKKKKLTFKVILTKNHQLSPCLRVTKTKAVYIN